MYLVAISYLSSEKKNIPTPWKVIRNSLGEGGLSTQILEAKYEAKLEFPGGRGCKTKTFPGGSMDIFWNYSIIDTYHESQGHLQDVEYL